MSDTSLAGATSAASVTTPEKSRTPSAQMIALLLLGGGAYALVAAIIYVVVFRAPAEPIRLMLAGFAGTLLTIPINIVGFYFGASLKQPTPVQP